MLDHSPPSIDATLERIGAGFCIRLPPVGVSPLRTQIVFMAIAVPFTIGMAVLGIWLVMHENEAAGAAFLTVWTLFSFAMAVLCLCAAVSLFHMVGAKSEIVMTKNVLSIRAKSRWRTVVREWRRKDVVAFDTDLGGLWVLTGGRERPMLPERAQAELRWLAETMGEAWHVPSREPRRPDELKIVVLITDEEGAPLELSGIRKPSTTEALAGGVRLQRGQLVVRSAANRRFPIRFVPRGQWFKNWRALFDGSLPLAADDFTWTEKDDRSCLHIAVRIPQGDGFDLWIWPDDADAVRSMVAAFLMS
jgi:hypothetical protein